MQISDVLLLGDFTTTLLLKRGYTFKCILLDSTFEMYLFDISSFLISAVEDLCSFALLNTSSGYNS